MSISALTPTTNYPRYATDGSPDPGVIEKVNDCVSRNSRPPTSHRQSGGLWMKDLPNAIRVTYDNCIVEEVSGDRFVFNGMSLAAETRGTLTAFKAQERPQEQTRAGSQYPQTDTMGEDGRKHRIFRGGRILLVDGNHISM